MQELPPRPAEHPAARSCPLKGSRTGSCRPRWLLATPAYAAEVAAKLIVHTNSFLICCKTVQKRGAKLTKT